MGRAQNTSMIIVFTDKTVFQYLIHGIWEKKNVQNLENLERMIVEGRNNIPDVTVINLINR